MYSSPLRADWLNQLQAELMQVLSSDGHRQSLEDVIRDRLADESAPPEATQRICEALAELIFLLNGRAYTASRAHALRACPEGDTAGARKPYRVLIGRVATSEGSIPVGGTAMLGDKDGERLTARHIIEPVEASPEPGFSSEGASYAVAQDPERRRAAVAAITGMLGGPTMPPGEVSDANVWAENPEAIREHSHQTSNSAPLEHDVQNPADALDPEQRLSSIAVAVSQLDPTVETNWLKSGAPDVKALEGVLGYHVTAAERDAAWEQHQAIATGQQGGQ